jgi:hypothetical protein
MRRRDLLRWAAALVGSATCGGVQGRDPTGEERLPPVRALTHGPKHHWFGYYDKREFDPTSRYVLGMEVDFEHRTPAPEDTITVGMVDLQDGDRWIPLRTTRAWCWQQGCMLQWLPGSPTGVIWNDREDGRFVCHILNVATRARRTLPSPIYALAPDARWAVSTDFRRLHDTRPGYGYAGIPDPNRDDPAPDDAGVWRVDLRSGRTDLLLSFRQVAAIPYLTPGEAAGAKHKFNHLLVSPDGSRFAFLHRWFLPGKPTATRLITADSDGSRLFVLDSYGRTSHYDWRDPERILAWAYHPSHGENSYLYKDRTAKVEVVGPDVMTVNGHCTYLPDRRWILNDTYPDRARDQHPYLYNVERGSRHALGHFRSPPEYTGEWRCDTHPRFSPDSRSVVIDSAHAGNGRQLYLIDISGVMG